MRKNRWIWMSLVVAAAGSASLATLAVARGGAPRVVQKRVAELFPGRDMKLHAERLGEQTIYETGTRTHLEVSFDDNASIVEVEAGIPLGLVPEPAMKAARKRFGADAKIASAEIVIRGETLLYELEGPKHGGGEKEVYLRPDGRVVGSHHE